MKRVNIAITMGDPAGIGPEVVVKAVRSLKDFKGARFTILGDKVLFRAAGLIESGDISVVDTGRFLSSFLPGKFNKASGSLSFISLNRAVALLKEGNADCLVTAPISKEAIGLAGFSWPGHTEYLADCFGVRQVEMVFISPALKTVLVTRHMSLRQAICGIHKERIVACGRLVFDLLKKGFGLRNPKVAVCGLNPHAGESGLFGREEEQEIRPAVKSLNKILGLHFFGPFSADTLFHRVCKGEFDLVMAMYHDQGLIPFKLASFDRGVNVTAGLPFIRTSPVHGTAFDIAGKNKANHHSMKQAILLAYELFKKGLMRQRLRDSR